MPTVPRAVAIALRDPRSDPFRPWDRRLVLGTQQQHQHIDGLVVLLAIHVELLTRRGGTPATARLGLVGTNVVVAQEVEYRPGVSVF
ncbi:hypothetical protein [Mycolicibacterium sarraceniae]|nr:hypothetical protein [Mycolicibacterium sarraceniae]